MQDRSADPRAARLTPLVVAGISFVVYLRTLLPGMAFGDWGEMQTVPHVLGVAHPTGYPTYIVLSWLAQLAPIGSVAFRSNLLSAGLVAVALGVTVAIQLRLGVRPLIAAGASLALGAVGTVWAAATVAEVNPLHLLFVALLLHRAMVWEERRAPRDLVLGGLLLGLAAGNHLLILFVAPLIVAYVLWVGRREIAADPRILALTVAAGLVGLSTYLYIPLAASQSPVLAYNHPVTLDAVLWLVSGEQFRGQFGFLSPTGLSDLVSALPALWSLAIDQATPILPILGAAGLGLLGRRRPALGLTLIGILVLDVYIWANYLRLEHYLLVGWLVIALGAAAALEAVAQALDGRLPWSRTPSMVRAGTLVGAAAVVLAAGLAATNWQGADRSADRTAETYVDAVLAALPPDAAILSEWDASTPLWHASFVLSRRLDVLIVDDTDIVYGGWVSRERRIAALICDRPVFMLRIREADLAPTRADYALEPVIAVRVAEGGPSAAVARTLYRIVPLDAETCAE
ncbi:MAG: DUF2723 domain-containing protein [Candidatus Limnocylindrales bacterium]